MPAANYEIYRRLPGLVLGFHGCDEDTGEDLLCGRRDHMTPSTNTHDWLGNGVYFWENDPQRAFEFAEEAVRRPHLTSRKITKPFVVGAVIDLGHCLNLLDRKSLKEVEDIYPLLQQIQTKAAVPMPENKGKDRGARFLDRAVLELLHTSRAAMDTGRSKGKYAPYDTVRGAFWEGGELYPNAGFEKKNHIQIAVRNLGCIKGYFRPIASP